MISFHSRLILLAPFLSAKQEEAMDVFTSFFDSQSSSRNRWTYDSLKNLRQLSPPVQNHLKLVYFTLCCALVCAAAGAYLHLVWNIGGFLTSLAFMGCAIWLLSTPSYEEKKRVSLLMAAATFQGATIGPLIDVAIKINPSILISAFGGTSLAFGCFSAAAMLAKRREYLYLGGLLSSGVSILLWLRFASAVFGASASLFEFELYFGLMIFVGYMVVDTQKMIERAYSGDLDYVKHALSLFLDFIGVFVRILIIMLRNSEKNEKKKKRRD